METFNYTNIPDRICFTYKDCMTVYYEDTERDEKRTFHSYRDGKLWKSLDMPRKDKEYFACDIKGNYIPVSLILVNRELEAKLKEALKKEFKSALPTLVKETK
mgnify:FL=1|jgi:hypothetical protein